MLTRLTYAGIDTNNNWAVENVVAAFRNLLDTTGARNGGEIWKSIEFVVYMWSGTDEKTKQHNYNIAFQLQIVGGNKPETTENFMSVLERNNYWVNGFFEIAGDVYKGKKNHENSARFKTESAWRISPHFIQQPGYDKNIFDLHWDPANSACTKCSSFDRAKAGLMHENSEYSFHAVEKRRLMKEQGEIKIYNPPRR